MRRRSVPTKTGVKKTAAVHIQSNKLVTMHQRKVTIPSRFCYMKSKERQVVDLEAELVRLNALVRERRKQLLRLENCPNKTCECRRVWREVVESELAGQIGRIRRRVKPNGTVKPKRSSKTRR